MDDAVVTTPTSYTQSMTQTYTVKCILANTRMVIYSAVILAPFTDKSDMRIRYRIAPLEQVGMLYAESPGTELRSVS